MTDLALNAPENPAPLTGADNLLVQRQGEPNASRTTADKLPVSTATAQALSDVALEAAQDATFKASTAKQEAIESAQLDATARADAARDDAIAYADSAFISQAEKGALNGVAPLVNGLVPSLFLPGAQDEILSFPTRPAFPATGLIDKLYVAEDTGKAYRWTGSSYVEIPSSPGTTDEVPEGPSGMRLYFMPERVNETSITGMVFNVLTPIANGETLRIILGKLQGQLSNAINNFAANVRATVLTGINTTADGDISATTTVLQSIGRLVARVSARLIRRLPDGTDMEFGNIGNGQLVRRVGTQFVGESSISDISYTIGERPPAAGNANEVIRLRQVGNVRSVWQESNGTNWGMQNGRATIIQDAFPASKPLVAMTGALVDLPDSYTIPGGLLNENAEVRIRGRFVSSNPTATNQVQVLINGSPVYESTAGSWFQQMGEVRFNNLGALNAQEFFGIGTSGTGFGNSNSNTYSNPAGSPGSLRSFNTASNLTITFKAIGASGTSIKLSGITVEVIDR